MSEHPATTGEPRNELEHDDNALRVRGVIDAPVAAVWDFVTVPGWFINDGALREHELSSPAPGRHVVIDPVHGEFVFDDVEVVPLVRYASSGAHTGGDTEAPATVTSFELAPVEGGTELVITETGFADLGLDPAATRAAINANVAAWVLELRLAREALAGLARWPRRRADRDAPPTRESPDARAPRHKSAPSLPAWWPGATGRSLRGEGPQRSRGRVSPLKNAGRRMAW